MKYEMMTTNEFHKFIDDLEGRYDCWLKDGFQGSILEFLDHEIGDKEYYKERINPLDVIRELHKCNMGHGIICDGGDGEDDPDYDFTPRFKILMGICECIEFMNRPKAQYKYSDILVKNNNDPTTTIYIMEVDNDRGVYYFDHFDGESDFMDIWWTEEHYHKIGKVTDDVMERLNPLYNPKSIPFKKGDIVNIGDEKGLEYLVMDVLTDGIVVELKTNFYKPFKIPTNDYCWKELKVVGHKG